MLKQQPPTIILSVSPREDDFEALTEILRPYNWTIYRALTLAAAMQLLTSHTIPLAICGPLWKEVLVQSAELCKPPHVIVASRNADDHLWVEALNLGAYDVLATPFDAVEVMRTVSIAALNWHCKYKPAVPPLAGASR